MTDEPRGQVVTFYSFKGGTGRSMALANVAWILAANGKRVLVADWDLDSPGLHRFYRPFLRAADATDGGGIVDLIRTYETEAGRPPARRAGWHEELARVSPYAFSLDWEFPDGGTLDFLPAGRQNADYSTLVSGLDWDDFYARLSGGLFFDALRDDMRRRYDYTLIDSRTGLSDVAQICTAHLPDTVVDCFTLSDQGIDGAAMMARTVLQQRRPIRVLPVPMRVDPAEKEKAEAGRELARRSFPGLPEGTDAERERYWRSVEVPYQAYYGYEETLATFGDVPGTPTSLLAAYEFLTATITGGDVDALPRMPESVRTRWHRRFERRTRPSPTGVVLVYAAADMVWAEWVQRILETVDLEVADPGPMESLPDRDDVPTGLQPVCLVSPHFDRALGELGDGWLDRRLPPLGIHLSGRRPGNARFAATATVSGLAADEAAEQLVGLVGKSGHPAAQLAWKTARYPAVEPVWFRVPVRNPRFTGRAEDFLTLRRQLTESSGAVALVALRGMGGVGKTQLAQEYAHRFRTAYDLVWWIPSEQAQFIDATIVDLAKELGLPVFPTLAETVRATLDALRRGEPTGRWLIVFDNADTPSTVLDLLSEGKGQVLVTSRNQDWGSRGTSLEVDVFRRAESIQHLRGRLPSMTAEQADRVASALGDLPIAVDAAGAWLAETGTGVDEYLRQLAERRSGPALAPVQAMFQLSLDQLRKRSPAAHHLLQICSVMAPEIALDLLYSDEMAAALRPFSTTVADRTERPALVRQLSRLSLLTLDAAGGQIHIHRVLQAFVRDGIPADQLGSVRHQAHLVLAGNRPTGEVEDPHSWPRFRMLWPHLDIAHLDIAGCVDESVRQLLIDRVRYLSRRKDWALGQAFGTAVEREWEGLLAGARTAPHHGSGSELRGLDLTTLERQLLQLRFNLANILRDQGRFDEAREIDESVLTRQTELLGPEHSNTLMTAAGYAADLRVQGRFTDSLALEERTQRAWDELFGEEHPRALAAANNLAVACRAVGDFVRARQLDEDVVRRRRIVHGPDHPLTLHSLTCLGRDLREAGEYEESAQVLRHVLARCRQSLGPNERLTLTALTSLAVSLRSAGRSTEAVHLLDDSLRRLVDHYGPDTPDAVACRMNRAANLLTLGEAPDAVRELRDVLRLYERDLGPLHPLSLVSKNNLSAAVRVDGDLDEAQRLAGEAAEGCAGSLGPAHPFTLAAAMNVDTCRYARGDRDGAADGLAVLVGRMEETLGGDHLDAIVCRLNLDVVLSEPMEHGRTAAARRDLAVLVRRLGDGHPTVAGLRGGSLSLRLIDPGELF